MVMIMDFFYDLVQSRGKCDTHGEEGAAENKKSILTGREKKEV